MWFDDEDINPGRLRLFFKKRGNRRKAILNVNTRYVDKKNTQRIGTGAMLAALIVGITVIAWLGCSFVFRALLSNNDRFKIEHLNITGGSALSRDLVTEYTQIKEGMNLFSFNITKVWKDFIKYQPNVKTLRISRQLPDTLEINITDRVPLARIGRKSPFVADNEGCIFSLKGSARSLSVMTGYRDPGMKPGCKLCGTMAMAALEVLEVSRSSELGLFIDEVELNNPEYIVLYILDGDKVKEVDLAWPEMGKQNQVSRKKLQKKLSDLVNAMKSESGRKMRRFNARFDDIVGEATI